MKNLYTLFFFLLTLQMVNAQSQVYLNIDQRAGEEALETSQGYTVDAGYDLNFTRLQYFISEIFLVHDGGQETKLDGLYILANALADNSYDLGQVNVSNVEGIRFHIGVDRQNNHADPALWPAGHPLAPSFPTMHWGWAAGYRFAAVEGKAGRGLVFTYQIHALGDQHYGAVELDVTPRVEGGAIHIDLQADYLKLFDGLDVSFGLIEHSDAPKAAQLLTNLKEKVFTAASVTSTRDNAFEGEFEIVGNPSSGDAQLRYTMPDNSDYEVQVLSISGQVIDREKISGSGMMYLENNSSAQAIVVLTRGGKFVKSLKLISQ